MLATSSHRPVHANLLTSPFENGIPDVTATFYSHVQDLNLAINCTAAGMPSADMAVLHAQYIQQEPAAPHSAAKTKQYNVVLKRGYRGRLSHPLRHSPLIS